MVRVLAFYSHNPCSNPLKSTVFSVKFVFEKTEKRPFEKKLLSPFDFWETASVSKEHAYYRDTQSQALAEFHPLSRQQIEKVAKSCPKEVGRRQRRRPRRRGQRH